jgi:hypothetical protein
MLAPQTARREPGKQRRDCPPRAHPPLHSVALCSVLCRGFHLSRQLGLTHGALLRLPGMDLQIPTAQLHSHPLRVGASGGGAANGVAHFLSQRKNICSFSAIMV